MSPPAPTIERPLHLVFVDDRRQAGGVFTRSLVVIEQGARAMLVESHEGRPAATIRSTPRSSSSSATTPMSITSRSPARRDDALHVSSLMAAIGAQGALQRLSPSRPAARVVRNQLFVRFDGEDTVAGIRGASLLKGRQHADTTLVVDHMAGGCQSREVFKSVLDDESRGVFQGKIIVRPRRAEDRRQDDDAGAAAVRRGRGRQQAGARDFRRRRAMRPWRDRGRARRGPAVLSDGARHSAKPRPRRC